MTTKTIDQHSLIVINAANALHRRGKLSQEQAEEIPGLWWSIMMQPALLGMDLEQASRLAYWKAVKNAQANRRLTDVRRAKYIDAIDSRDVGRRIKLDEKTGRWSRAAIADAQERNAKQDSRKNAARPDASIGGAFARYAQLMK